jgi:polygalacturonase
MQVEKGVMERQFNVLSYNAKGNGEDNDTKSIQNAIDACSNAGGGIVYFPPGIYLTGTICLRDNITLFLEAGASLLSSINKDDFLFIQSPEKSRYRYTRCGLIFGKDLSNITITGRGCIIGRDKHFWIPKEKIGESWRSSPARYVKKEWRPMSLLFENCQNIVIEDINIKESPCYSGFFNDCTDIKINNVSVLNDLYGPNTDGFHFTSCKFVHICNSHFLTGDDSIAIDGNGIQDAETFTITNCTFNTSINALRVYTGLDPGMTVEDSQSAVVRNVSMSNCSVYSAADAINITSDNGLIENLCFSNITMTTKKEGTPIFLMTAAGKIRGVMIDNISAMANGACTIIGTKESYIEDISINNGRFYIEPKKKLYELDIPDPIPGYAHHHFSPFNIYLRYVKDIRINNVTFKWMQPESDNWGSAVKCNCVEYIELSRFKGRHAGNSGKYPTIIFNNVKNAFIHGCLALEGTVNYLGLSGAESRNINLLNNDLSRSKCPVVLNNDVTEDIIEWVNNLGARP